MTEKPKKGEKPVQPDEDMQKQEAEKVQAATGHTVPQDDLPENEMTAKEREQAGLDPVEGEEGEENK